MFIGHYQLGNILPLRLWTRTNAGVPTEPDAAPFVQIIDESGRVAYATKLPIVDRARITGYFLDPLNLDGRFTAMRYTIFYTYAISGTILGCKEEFEILGGGDTRGAGISMAYFRQSGADYVLLQNHAGALEKLKNPEIRNR